MARKFKTEEDKANWEKCAKQELIGVEQQAFATSAFYKLTPKVAVDAVDASLSATAYRLWIYLSSLYQFGDRFEYIPTQSELAARLGVSRQSILRATADLEEAKLWEFRVERWKGRNLTGHSSDNYVLQENRTCTKNVTPPPTDVTPYPTDVTSPPTDVTPCTNDERLHNIDRARAQTIQTNTDLKETLSEKSENKKRKTVCTLEKSEETKLQPSATLTTKPETQQTNLTISSRNGLAVMRRHEPFYNRRIDPKDIQWDWIPEGPWKTEQGKLDTPFQTAIAQRWIKEHGGDLHEKKANVLKHFKNDPANLPIEWEWYQNTILHKAASIQVRKLAGADTGLDEQEILKHGRAFAQLPQEMRVTEERSPEEVLLQVAPHTLAAISEESQLMALEPPKDQHGTINPEAYQKGVSAEDAAYWQNFHAQRASTEKTEEQPTATDEELSDAKAKAKALVESLKEKHKPTKAPTSHKDDHNLSPYRELKEKRERTKSLTSIADVFSPQQAYAMTLEDMRKYLNSGSDVCRQIALDWASDPVNGCELVRVKGQVVDIREMEF